MAEGVRYRRHFDRQPAGDKIIVTFNAGYTLPGLPVVTLAGFTNCGRGIGVASKTITVTLADSGGNTDTAQVVHRGDRPWR